MSIWSDLNLNEKIVSILSNIEYRDPTHHFGKPFISAYQLAIFLTEGYPQVYQTIGKPIGGEGIGKPASLAQYLARELSMRIKSGEINNIEGAFISNKKLKDILFKHGDDEIKSSVNDLSMFRLSDKLKSN